MAKVEIGGWEKVVSELQKFDLQNEHLVLQIGGNRYNSIHHFTQRGDRGQ